MVRLTLLLTLTTAAVAPCSGQARIEVTPFVGAYLPGNDFGSKIVTDGGVDERYTSGTSWGQEDAPIAGAQFAIWPGNRIAVELGPGIRRAERSTACGRVSAVRPLGSELATVQR